MRAFLKLAPVPGRVRAVVLLAAAALAAVLAVAVPVSGRASAHPLGNFTVNRYSAITLSPTGISISYVLDMAEIPAFQEVRAMDANSDGTPDSAEQAAYLERTSEELVRNLKLTLNGRAVGVQQVESRIAFPAGQGGLDTLRIELDLSAGMPQDAGSPVTLAFEDRNFKGRLGWQEIIVRPEAGVSVASSDVPSQDLTNGLRTYPKDRLQSPVVRGSATVRFELDAGAAGTQVSRSPATTLTSPSVAPGQDRLQRLLSAERLGPGVVLLALLVAAGVGAVHALTPGHGKTLMAAYLAGSRGATRHAVMLGGIVAVSHTAGVLALGAVILFAAKTVTPEAIYPYLGVAAGAIVLVIGLRMIAARLRVAPWRFGRSNAADGATGHGHSHGHGGEHRHDSPHEHSHEHPAPHTHVHGVPHSHDDDSGHGHTHHAPVPGATVTWKSLLAIGLADGLVPSASALLIWLAAIGIGREAFGLALVAAFGLGMAAVLTGIGLLLVHGRGLFERRVAPRFHLASRVSAAVPLITALFVAGAGLALVIRAMRQFGVV